MKGLMLVVERVGNRGAGVAGSFATSSAKQITRQQHEDQPEEEDDQEPNRDAVL